MCKREVNNKETEFLLNLIAPNLALLSISALVTVQAMCGERRENTWSVCDSGGTPVHSQRGVSPDTLTHGSGSDTALAAAVVCVMPRDPHLQLLDN